jgi:hypothetical protein
MANKQLKANRRLRKTIKATASQDIIFSSGNAELVEGASGNVPVVHINAYNGGKLRLANYPNPVVIDMAGVKAMGSQLPILRDHDQKRPVGHGNPVIGNENLKIEGSLSIEGEERDKIVAGHKNGFQWQASVGGSIPNYRKDVTTVAAGSSVTVNGRSHEGPLHVVKAFLWKETSFVALGADEERASASVAASHEPKRGVLMNEFEKWLAASGINPSELSDDQVSNLKATFEAAQVKLTQVAASGTAVDTSGAVNAAVQAMRSESQRLTRIDKLFANFSNIKAEGLNIEELRDQVVAGSISEDNAHLRMLQASRNTNTSNVAGSMGSTDLDALAIEASAYAEAGISQDLAAQGLAELTGSRETAQRAVDLATGPKYRRGGIFGRIIAAACYAAGKPYVGRHEDEQIRCAMEHSSIQAASGFSTVSLAGILGRTANKAMLAAYAEAEAAGVMTRIASITSTSDFKKFDRYRMTEAGIMEQVPAAGELKFGTLTQDAYENQVRTYGKLIALTRTMMYNDDLNAFLQIPRMLGRQGRHALEQIGLTALVNATTAAGAGTTEFFHGAARGNDQINYFEGATTNLSIDSLEVAYELFLNQTDSSGKPILISPSILLTCTGDAVMARKLFRDTEYRFTTASLKETVNNQWQGMFRPEVSPYLGRLGTTVNTSQWYLLSEPTTDVAALQIAFLNGMQTPTVDSGSMDMNVLGMTWRGIFDFGIGLQDPRAVVKSKGKA